MSDKRKGVRKNFRFSEEVANKLETIKEKGNYASETLAVEKAIELLHKSLEKNFIILQEALGDELYQRHLDFLEKEKQEGESLKDVFHRFIKHAGVQVTKEEWLERVKAGERVDHFKVLEPSLCHYRAINEKGEWFCDTKKIDPSVCIKRQERFQYMKRKCKPITIKRGLAPQGRVKRRGIQIPQSTSCPYRGDELVSIRQVCYNPKDPCEAHRYCRSLDHYKQQIEKARLRGRD